MYPSAHRTRALARGVLVGLAALAPLGSTAFADPTPAQLSKARLQFQQGLALETAGDWAGALGLFQEVGGVKMTPQVRFNIAVCEEHLGKLALALGDYKLAVAEADGGKAPEVATQAPGKVENLLSRIPKIVVKRGAGADFAVISLDGVSLGASSIGGEMPVDPGPHTIEARAPGFNLFITSFNIAEKQVKAIDVTLARIAAAGNHAPVDGPAGDLAVDGKRSGGQERATAKPSALPYVIGGLGAASLAASGVFFALRSSAIADLDRQCPSGTCPASAQATFDKGKRYSTLANITLAVGIVGLGTGAVLYFTQDKPAKTPVDASLGAPGALAGATFHARF
jgi:hypothetical protein